MAITIREDEAEAGGFALIDLGLTIEADPIRLSFRRQGAEPRDLGAEGWQPETAWHDAERMSGSGRGTVVRVGPAVVDWIDELVPVEIAIEGMGLLGTVVWPHLTRSPGQLTDTRIGAAAPRVARAPATPPQRPPPAAPSIVPSPRPEPEEAAPPVTKPTPVLKTAAPLQTKKRHAPIVLLALLVIAFLVAAAAPLVALHFDYYGFVVEAHEPLDFVETLTGNSSSFTPASATIEVRRAKWATWFEGWWLRNPPPAVPAIGDPWLTAVPGAADSGGITFALVPEPKAFPAGVPKLQTTIAFRNTASGTATDPQTATLQRAPGTLTADQPAGASFRGRQGGPFAPAQFTFNLAAKGLGFGWQVEGAPPPWFEVAPTQGELRDNASTPAVVRLRPAAASLGPGTFESELFFKNVRSGEVVERVVRIVVEPRPEPPPGRLVVELPNPLDFAGPQGGPFAPSKMVVRLKAAGTGFKWTVEGAPPWLELVPAQGELRDNGEVELTVQPRAGAQALAAGMYQSQLIFRKVGVGDSVTETVRLEVSKPTGRLSLEAATPLVFSGPQGGPFAPQRVAFNLKAMGTGFRWTVEGAPTWLELMPAQGELRDNGSIEIAARPRPGAQTLNPGTYESQITFKKTGPDQSVTQTVRLVVSISFR